MNEYIISSEHGATSVQARDHREAARRGRIHGARCYMTCGSDAWVIGPRGGVHPATRAEREYRNAS